MDGRLDFLLGGGEGRGDYNIGGYGFTKPCDVCL